MNFVTYDLVHDVETVMGLCETYLYLLTPAGPQTLLRMGVVAYDLDTVLDLYETCLQWPINNR